MKTPSDFVLELAKDTQIGQLELGLYKYLPESTRDVRQIIRSSRKSTTPDYLLSLKERARGQDRDLALHSRVWLTDSNIKHVPMIDFTTGDLEPHMGAVRTLMKKFSIQNAFLFSSGRSFHLYGLNLLSEGDWKKFMGHILLLNPENTQETNEDRVTDSYWVGHRLIAGYGSLRLSCHQEHYLSPPVFYRELTL